MREDERAIKVLLPDEAVCGTATRTPRPVTRSVATFLNAIFLLYDLKAIDNDQCSESQCGLIKYDPIVPEFKIGISHQ